MAAQSTVRSVEAKYYVDPQGIEHGIRKISDVSFHPEERNFRVDLHFDKEMEFSLAGIENEYTRSTAFLEDVDGKHYQIDGYGISSGPVHIGLNRIYHRFVLEGGKTAEIVFEEHFGI